MPSLRALFSRKQIERGISRSADSRRIARPVRAVVEAGRLTPGVSLVSVHAFAPRRVAHTDIVEEGLLVQTGAGKLLAFCVPVTGAYSEPVRALAASVRVSYFVD